jgi:hypothetical protein
MVQTRAKASGTPAAHTGKSADTAAGLKKAVGRTAELSDDVLKSVEAGQRAALDAVRKFVDTVDEALPAIDGRPSMREKVIDAALDMADKLVTTQYDFLRNVVRSAEGALTSGGGTKEE